MEAERHDRFDARRGVEFEEPRQYRFIVQGEFNPQHVRRLGSLRIEASPKTTPMHAVTSLAGRVRDQTELMGILHSIHELHLTILEVEAIDGGSMGEA